MATEEQKNRLALQDVEIADNMRNIKHRILVFSGKGGVGKTTVSLNIAHGLQVRQNQTGILDADISGPNVPQMLGLKEQVHAEKDRIIPLKSHGMEVISIASLITPDQPVIWRGPMRSKLLYQFLGDVEWGQLDYLIADLPPGTGDEIITLTQKMEPDLAVIVTTPQEVSLIDSRRAVNLAKKMKIPRIGIIENMSGLICPKCGCQIDLFDTGGGKRQAEQMHVTFLGALPIDIEVRKKADAGQLTDLTNNKSRLSSEIMNIVEKIENMFKNQNN